MPRSQRLRVLTAAMILAAAVSAAPLAHATKSPAGPARGVELYQLYCASCHGDAGKGDGPLTNRHNWWQIEASDHSKKPRDFTRDWFRYGDSKADVIRTISAGSGYTAMEGFEQHLTESDIEALAAVILNLRADMSNAVIQQRFPDRIPTDKDVPHFHRMPALP